MLTFASHFLLKCFIFKFFIGDRKIYSSHGYSLPPHRSRNRALLVSWKLSPSANKKGYELVFSNLQNITLVGEKPLSTTRSVIQMYSKY